MKVGGWIINGCLYAQIKVGTELWYYSRRDGGGEREYHLLFVGWYVKCKPVRLFTVNILWVSV